MPPPRQHSLITVLIYFGSLWAPFTDVLGPRAPGNTGAADGYIVTPLYTTFHITHVLPRDAMLARYMLWPCVCLSVSVCLSQVSILLKWLNTASHKQHNTIAQGLWFSDAKDLREIRPGSPPMGASNVGGVGQNRRLSTNNRPCLENGKR